MNRGFILIESSIALVIISCSLFTFMLLFVVVVRAGQKAADIAAADELVSSLMEEVRLRRWDDGSPAPEAGAAPRPGQSKKTAFNAVGDFDGWTETPPVGPMMEPLPSFGQYTRRVEVGYVDSSLVPSAVPTDYRHVRVCAWTKGMKPACLDTIVTNR